METQDCKQKQADLARFAEKIRIEAINIPKMMARSYGRVLSHYINLLVYTEQNEQALKYIEGKLTDIRDLIKTL